MMTDFEKKTTSENRRQVGRKTPNVLDEWNGYSEIFSLSQGLDILGNICSFDD